MTKYWLRMTWAVCLGSGLFRAQSIGIYKMMINGFMIYDGWQAMGDMISEHNSLEKVHW